MLPAIGFICTRKPLLRHQTNEDHIVIPEQRSKVRKVTRRSTYQAIRFFVSTTLHAYVQSPSLLSQSRSCLFSLPESSLHHVRRQRTVVLDDVHALLYRRPCRCERRKSCVRIRTISISSADNRSLFDRPLPLYSLRRNTDHGFEADHQLDSLVHRCA